MANRGHEPKQKQPPRSGKHLFLLKKMGFQAAWYGCKNSMASQTPPLTYPSSRAYWIWVSFGNALLLEAYLWGGTLGGRLTSHDKSLLLNRKSLLLRIEILMWWIWGCPNILGGVKVLGPKAKRMLLNAKKMGDINFNFLKKRKVCSPNRSSRSWDDPPGFQKATGVCNKCCLHDWGILFSHRVGGPSAAGVVRGMGVSKWCEISIGVS